MAGQLFRTKSIDQLISDSELPDRQLKKSLGWLSLTALGIGAVIGSGIFTLTGTAAAGKVEKLQSILNATVLDVVLFGSHAGSQMGRPGAGPAITLSFVLVAIACVFAGLCYAELSSMIPIAGSAYTYSYAILGEIFAWIIGWDLILEYAVSNMSVAVGFSATTSSDLCDWFGWNLLQDSTCRSTGVSAAARAGPRRADRFNVPALVDHHAGDGDPGAGRQGKRRSEHDDGADQDRRDSDLLFRGGERDQARQLASLRAQRILGRADGRVDRVLHLHRFRLGIDGGRGVPRTRSATCRSGSSRR